MSRFINWRQLSWRADCPQCFRWISANSYGFMAVISVLQNVKNFHLIRKQKSLISRKLSNTTVYPNASCLFF